MSTASQWLVAAAALLGGCDAMDLTDTEFTADQAIVEIKIDSFNPVAMTDLFTDLEVATSVYLAEGLLPQSAWAEWNIQSKDPDEDGNRNSRIDFFHRVGIPAQNAATPLDWRTRIQLDDLSSLRFRLPSQKLPLNPFI